MHKLWSFQIRFNYNIPDRTLTFDHFGNQSPPHPHPSNQMKDMDPLLTKSTDISYRVSETVQPSWILSVDVLEIFGHRIGILTVRESLWFKESHSFPCLVRKPKSKTGVVSLIASLWMPKFPDTSLYDHNIIRDRIIKRGSAII